VVQLIYYVGVVRSSSLPFFSYHLFPRIVEMPKKKPKIGGAVLNADFSYFFYVAQSDPSFDLFIIITLYISILIY
jgi:hypothetical protein